MVNEEGGINGRKINYISYDDAYSPPKTVEMTRRLVEQDQVAVRLPLAGHRPPTRAIQKYINQKHVPQLFVGTGATKWRDPKNFPWTMAWQPTYQIEGRIYAQYVLKNMPDAKICILYQNNDYGKDYIARASRTGSRRAAQKLIVLKESVYEVTDTTVDSQIVNLKDSRVPHVFFNITTSKAGAQAIRKAYDLGWKPSPLP